MPEAIRAQLEAEAAAAAEQGVAIVFRENWDAYRVFQHSQTQWNVVAGGMSGRRSYIGLIYASLPVALDMCDIADSDRREVMRAVRVMEACWLDEQRQVQAEQAEETV